MDDPSKSFKILVVGDSGVGKTSLAHHISTGKPLLESSWTVGCNVHVKLHDLDPTPTSDEDKLYSLEFWDIGGSTRYADTRPVFWTTPPDGILLVHDLSNRKSYENLKAWHAEVMRPPTAGGTGTRRDDGSGWPDDNAMFDPEAAAGAGTAISFVIGTKLDLSPAKSGGRDVLASELGAGSAHINSTDPAAMKPGTQARTALDEFFSRLIARRNPQQQSGSGSGPGYPNNPRRKHVVGGGY